MKIKIPSIGSRGDVQPFIALGQGLACAGHEVTILSHPEMRKLVESYGIPFAAVGPDVDMEEVAASIRERTRNDWIALREVMKSAFEILERSHKDILEDCRGSDLVVISASSAAGKNEAEILGMPYASVNLMPWGIRYSEPGRPFYKRILYGAIDEIATQVTTRPMNRIRHRLGLPPIGQEGFASPVLDLVPISSLVYPANPNWAPQHRVTGYWFVGGLGGWQPEEEILNFLEAGDPPLVVSLGAMRREPEGKGETAALFVSALQQAGLRAIFLGWEAELRDINLAPNMIAAGSIPFAWLLPRAAGIVHHGGFGSTAEGLRAGIPALVIPHMVDQFFWAQKVFDLGVGPRSIPRKKLDLILLTASLKELVENQTYRLNAAKLGAQIQHENGIEHAVRLIQGMC